MIYNTKIPAGEKETMQGFMRQHKDNKVVHPKEKIGDKIPKDFYPRSEQKN